MICICGSAAVFAADDTDESSVDFYEQGIYVSPSSKPYHSKYTKSKKYNKYTKQYFMVRSYLEMLEKQGGGVLIFQRGTYTITNTLYVPSNVTIIFEDGVTIVKGKKTACKKMKASKTIFQLIEPSFVETKKKKYGYNGAHDINFIGKGNVTIDCKHISGSIAIVMGHCRNISISNINFVNMSKNCHLIELNSSQNVTIKNCDFNANVSSGTKEAINIDSTDKNTKGFNNSWSSHDRTCCDTVVIEQCSFRNVSTAIGTHKYSYKNGKQQYHKNVTIRNCSFNNIGNKKNKTSTVHMMNWKDAVVENNTFQNIKYYGVLCHGVDNPTIQYNQFYNMIKNPILIQAWKNKGAGKKYPKSYIQNLELVQVLRNWTDANTKVITYYNNQVKVIYPELIP
jgi:hypothetical protein